MLKVTKSPSADLPGKYDSDSDAVVTFVVM